MVYDKKQIFSVSAGLNHVDTIYPGYDVMQMALYFCGFPSPNSQHHSNNEGNILQIPLEEYPARFLTITPQNCPGH